jgi:Cd2+/Zn2+-exporting ATPase
MQNLTLQLPVVLPGGPECEHCVARLQTELSRIKGVDGASVNNARTDLFVEFDPDLVTFSRIELEAHRIGAEIDARIEHQTIDLKDLDCPDCANSIERSVSKLNGVLWASANFAAAQMHVEFERGKSNIKQIKKTIEEHGVRACPLSMSPEDAREMAKKETPARIWWQERRRLILTIVSCALVLGGAVAHIRNEATLQLVLFAASIASGGFGMIRAALASISRRTIDMNVLMAIAVVGAAAIGEWGEAATVVALNGIGTLLQAGAMEKTRRGLRLLMDATPKTARVIRGTGEFEVPVDQVRLWERVVVRPGERIPMDGVLLVGETDVNQAPITGESAPVSKEPGDTLFAGTLNGSAAIEMKVSHIFKDTTLARIIHRVEEAQSQRAPTQQLIDRFAQRYTPIVVAIALLVALGPPTTQWIIHTLNGASMMPGYWNGWLHRGLSLLIIACPCALVISTPVAIVTAIGRAARNGVLIKGGAYLEEIERVRAVLYDKTGTLTHGKFQLEDVIPLAEVSCNDMLHIASAIESRSEHPLASAFALPNGEGTEGSGELVHIEQYQALSGMGAMAKVDRQTYLIGNATLMLRQGVPLADAQETLARVEAMGKTAVIIATPNRPIGVAVLSDIPRDGTAQVILDMKKLGVRYQAMLTGDNTHVAQAVANVAGLEEFKAKLLPDDKLNLVKEFQWRYGSVAMVGDGINDAPALAAANVGIVMGAAGSDVAMETADVALMSSDLSRLPFLVKLSRKTHAIIRQNIVLSLATKAVLVVAATTTVLPLWIAVLGDVGISLLVTLNALRLRWA